MEPMNLCQAIWDTINQFLLLEDEQGSFWQWELKRGRQDVIKQSPEAICLRSLASWDHIKAVIDWVERGCLKTIIWCFIDLQKVPPCCTPAFTNELMRTPWRKKERLNRESRGQPGPEGLVNLNILKLFSLCSLDSSLLGVWRLRLKFPSCWEERSFDTNK